MSISIKLDDKKLKDLVKLLKQPIPVARIGIFGDKNGRSSTGGVTNAEIGARHEFGEDGMPVRSFLRMPLTEKLSAALEKSGAFGKDALDQVQKDGTFAPFVKKIGLVGEQVIQQAFATGGFGKWKPSNMANKKVLLTLVETQQLRNSITSEVKGK